MEGMLHLAHFGDTWQLPGAFAEERGGGSACPPLLLESLLNGVVPNNGGMAGWGREWG